MTQQQFAPTSGLRAFVLKSLGLPASTAILLATHSASALTNPLSPTSPPDQLVRSITLAQNRDSKANTAEEPRFTCEVLDGEYTVMYHPESQPGEGYAWATPTAMGGGWSEEERCNEISRRLESYRPDGLLEMQTAVENNYNIICVTTQQVADCRIVLTVPPGQDPQLTRDRVFENLTVADSGQSTDAVATFVGGDSNSELLDRVLNESLSALGIGKNSMRRSDRINLRPFLDPSDGGTGTQLHNGHPVRTNPRLKPDNFR
ncbi:MAG TPA: hypothetical protein DDZ80_13070 [Cyanobacteria bacterium UBA8803]|nr:hypothetical protein [Cyanobacteria bacterium UBA9273]HBL59404.1 hypothetical protein [Cyanobacteria bacterium UBA8803]